MSQKLMKVYKPYDFIDYTKSGSQLHTEREAFIATMAYATGQQAALMSQPDEKCPGCGHVEHKNRDKRCQVDMGHRFCNCLKGVTFSASLDKTAPPAPPIAQDTMREGQPDPLADLVVGAIICPGVPEHEHKIYRSELFKEYQGTTASIQGLVDERNDWRAQALAHPTGQQEAALREALEVARVLLSDTDDSDYFDAACSDCDFSMARTEDYPKLLDPGQDTKLCLWHKAYVKFLNMEALSTPATQESAKQS